MRERDIKSTSWSRHFSHVNFSKWFAFAHSILALCLRFQSSHLRILIVLEVFKRSFHACAHAPHALYGPYVDR